MNNMQDKQEPQGLTVFSLPAMNVPSEDWLGAFYRPTDTLCIRVFADKKGSDYFGQKITCVLEEFPDKIESLIAHNKHGRGIFNVINQGGHDDASISRITAHFVEMDDVSLEEQLARIQEFPLPPSLIAKTAKSLHCYWLMSEGGAEVPRFRHIQKQLVAQFNGDAACVNESRVLRIPGFYHCKGEPILVECVKFNPEIRYTQDQLSEHLPSIPDSGETAHNAATTHSAPMNVGTQKGLVKVGTECPFLQHCKKNAKTLCEPDWQAMISNLVVFEGGVETIHKLSKPHPEYDFGKTQRKIENICKSGTKPITCQTIMERSRGKDGAEPFRCPNYGKCKSRSPAGLAYFPMDVDDIIKRLESLKIEGTTVKKMVVAKEFINNFLFNIDSAVATTLIGDDIKQRFSLKTPHISELISYYKEVSKEFFTAQKSKRDKGGGELPDWYECTKSGGLKLMTGVLADYLRDNFHAFYATEQYYYYKNGVYIPRDDKDAKATVRTYLNPRDVTMNQINDVEMQWQLIIRKPVQEINSNKFIINTQNGLYNVFDDVLRPHNPKYLSTVQMKADYNPYAECPLFLAFLGSVLEPPEIALLQEIYGYFLVPVTRAQKSFLLCGKPNVGKSTILTCLQEIILGAENVSNIPLQNLGDRFQPAELFGKLANLYADLSNKGIDDASMFKAVTGEDYINGERKHKNPFYFKPYARFMYSCNDIPRNYGERSDAFYRRLIIIKFNKEVPPHKKDLELIDKLKDEADGILAWSIIGLKRLIKNQYQFNETDRTLAELNAYKLKNNNVLAFIAEACVVEVGAIASRSEMFDSYRAFCRDGGHGSIAPEHDFNEDVCNFDSTIKMENERVTRRRLFRGIRLA